MTRQDTSYPRLEHVNNDILWRMEMQAVSSMSYHYNLWKQFVACVMTWKIWQDNIQTMHDQKIIIMTSYQGWKYKHHMHAMIF